MFMLVCQRCGETASCPVEATRTEKLSDTRTRVYGTLCVCACDPRWKPPSERWRRLS